MVIGQQSKKLGIIDLSKKSGFLTSYHWANKGTRSLLKRRIEPSIEVMKQSILELNLA